MGYIPPAPSFTGGAGCPLTTYTQAIEITGMEEQTLRVYKYVAGEIELLIRINNLSWSHHRNVASLEPKEQEAWLIKKTLKEKLNISSKSS